jgi:hypothetical protein
MHYIGVTSDSGKSIPLVCKLVFRPVLPLFSHQPQNLHLVHASGPYWGICTVLVVAIIWTGRNLDRSINKQPGVKQKSQTKLCIVIHHDAMFLRLPGRLCCKLSRGPLMALLSVYSN